MTTPTSSVAAPFDPTCPVERFSKIILPLTDLVCALLNRGNPVQGFTKRQESGDIPGNPTIWDAHLKNTRPHNVELNKSEELIEGFLYYNNCDYVSTLICHLADKVLQDDYLPALRRVHMKARTFFIHPDAPKEDPIKIPFHTIVRVAKYHNDDSTPAEAKVIDGTLPQFGWPISDRVLPMQDYLLNYMDLVDPLIRPLNEPTDFDEFWTEAQRIIEEALEDFPWEERWSVMEKAQEKIMHSATKKLEQALIAKAPEVVKSE